MKTTALRQLIKESIQEYIREVETSGNIAAQEAKIRACEEAIALREKKANMEGLDEAYHDMMDQSKLNELKKEIKELQKYKLKTERLLEKMKSKGGKDEKEVVKDGMGEEGIVDEVTIDEMDPESGPQLEEDSLNESFLHMQKLAGLITETQYKKKMRTIKEIDAADVKKGEIYMYKWSDKYSPIKVKILGDSSYGDGSFVVEALEDKDGLKKGNQYIAKAEALSPIPVA